MTSTSPATGRHAPIDLSPGEFRDVGHALVDRVADLLASMHDRKVTSGLSVDEVRTLVSRFGSMPDEGGDAASIVTTRYLGKPEAEMKRLAIQAYRRNDPVGTINPGDITVTYVRDDQGRPIKVTVRVRARYDQMQRRSESVSSVRLAHMLFTLPEHPTEQPLAEAKERAAKALR